MKSASTLSLMMLKVAARRINCRWPSLKRSAPPRSFPMPSTRSRNRRAVCERPSKPSTQKSFVPFETALLCARWRLANGAIVSAVSNECCPCVVRSVVHSRTRRKTLRTYQLISLAFTRNNPMLNHAISSRVHALAFVSPKEKRGRLPPKTAPFDVSPPPHRRLAPG